MRRRLIQKPSFLFAITALTLISITHASRPHLTRIPANYGTEAVIDSSCSLTPSIRRERIKMAESYRQRSGAMIRTTEAIIEDYETQLRQLNRAYVFSKRAMTVATVASLMTGAAGVYEVFFLARGMALFGMSLSLKASQVFMGTSLAGRVVMAPSQVAALKSEVQQREKLIGVTKSFDQAVSEMEGETLLSDENIQFMTQNHCGGKNCRYTQRRIEKAFENSVDFYAAALDEMRAKDRWYKPDALTRLEGKIIAEVHLPWQRIQLEILRMRQAHAEELLRQLHADADFCN